MDKIIKEQHMVSLIVKEMTSTISDAEAIELQDWLSESSENRAAYEQLRQMDIRREIGRYRYLDASEGWKKYKKATGRMYKLRIRMATVAAAMIILSLGTFYWMKRQPEKVEMAAISPGTSKAVLILADGTRKNLTQQKEEEIWEQGVTTVKNDGTLLKYRTTSARQDSVRILYHELQTPKGGEYQLMLSDGTRVWLNAQTHLKYPMQFAGAERVVYLEGEAYFEVARDTAHPFRVVTDRKVTVEVLGTSFNVKAYRDDELIETVLEEGAVRMTDAGRQIVLKPGERGVYRMTDGRLELGKVDTRIYTSWRKGLFVFDDVSIEVIMRDLARWYDIEIFYSDEEVKHQMFNGKIKRYDNIQGLLKAIELAGGVCFELNGRTLIVGSAIGQP